MEDLQRVYELLSNEFTKAKNSIDRIDRILENCDRLSAEYWCDVRAEAVAYLNGLSKAVDVVFKELHK